MGTVGYCSCGRSKAVNQGRGRAVIWWTRRNKRSRAYTPIKPLMRPLGAGRRECPWCHDTLRADGTATPAQAGLPIASR